jgi:hypothetical protein
MNAEGQELHRLLPDRDLPSDRHNQLREFFMQQIQADVQAAPAARRRPLVRLMPVLASGLAVAAAVVGLGGLGSAGPAADPGPGTEQPALTPVSRTFELAAVTASTQPYTAPRPDQWIYIKTRNLSPSAIAQDKGQAPDVTREFWLRADGTQMAEFNEIHGKVQSWNQDNGYPALAALPTDPVTLLALLRTQITAQLSDPNIPQAQTDVDALLFTRIAGILDQNLLPPAVTAALWRVAALVPGVTQAPETLQIDRRRAIAVGRIQDGWRFEQLLVDPETYDYIGYRSVATKDHTYPDVPNTYPDNGPNGPVTEHAGSVQFALTRIAASIVDNFGQRPTDA